MLDRPPSPAALRARPSRRRRRDGLVPYPIDADECGLAAAPPTFWPRSPACRWAGWWEFEAPVPRSLEREKSTLYEAGLLTEPERVALVGRSGYRLEEPTHQFSR